jgi:hypothetical protein
MAVFSTSTNTLPPMSKKVNAALGSVATPLPSEYSKLQRMRKAEASPLATLICRMP